MNRETAEHLILEHVKLINEIYKAYNPNGHYLSISIYDGYINCNNEHWDRDANSPIDFGYKYKENNDD